MQAKRRIGRPKLPQESVRRFVIGMTVTAQERKKIKAAAEAEDLSISAWLRKMVFEVLKNG